MDKRIVLLNELSHKGSWGRNQVLKLNIDTELQNKVSSGFETPNVSCGEAMFVCVKSLNMPHSDVIERVVKSFYDIGENLDKTAVISFCISHGLNQGIMNIFETKLRARNSKRHLKEKLLLSYLTYIH